MTVTPLKRIRVDDDLWDDFGAAAEASGTDRSKLLVAFMRRYVAAFSVVRSATVVQGTDAGHSAP